MKKIIYIFLLIVVIILLARTWGNEGAEDEYHRNLDNLPKMQTFVFDAGKVSGDEIMKTLSFDPIEVMPGLMLERTIKISESDGLEWNLAFDSSNFDGEYTHIENIPKSFAGDVSQIAFSIEPDEIIDADPSVAWIMKIKAGFKMNIIMNVALDRFMGKELDLMTVIENFDDIRIFVGLEKCRLAEGDYGRLLCMIDLIGKNPEKFTLEHCKGLADFKQVDHEEGIAEMQACRAFLKNDITECQNYEVYDEDEYSSVHCEKHAFLTAYASCLGKDEIQKDYCIVEKAVWAGYADGCKKANNILPYQRCLAQVNQDDDACVKLMNYENMFSEKDYIDCCNLLEDEAYRSRCVEYVSDEKESKEDVMIEDKFAVEFNCSTPVGAEHVITDTEDYWKINDNVVGLFKYWYEKEKENKSIFKCYNIEGRQQGLHREWFKDGTLHYERNYNDGKTNGTWKAWYEDGILFYEKNYKDEKKDGVQREWYKDGILHFENNYIDDKKDGMHKAWHENGTLKNENNYKNDKMAGLQRWWHQDGTLFTEYTKYDGGIQGMYRAWYKDGRPWEETSYVDGKKEGISKTWFENGIVEECIFENNNEVTCSTR